MKKQKNKNLNTLLLLILPIIFVVAACSGIRVKTDKAAGVDLEAYNTYAWLPTPDKEGKLDPAAMAKLREQVNEEMQARGYKLDPTNPGLLVLVHPNLNKNTTLDVDANYSYYAPGFYTGPIEPFYYVGYNTIPNIAGYDIDKVEYAVGTIVVDVIDADKRQIVWRGWGKDKILQDNLPLEVAEYIDEIYDDFPVEQNN